MINTNYEKTVLSAMLKKAADVTAFLEKQRDEGIDVKSDLSSAYRMRNTTAALILTRKLGVYRYDENEAVFLLDGEEMKIPRRPIDQILKDKSEEILKFNFDTTKASTERFLEKRAVLKKSDWTALKKGELPESMRESLKISSGIISDSLPPSLSLPNPTSSLSTPTAQTTSKKTEIKKDISTDINTYITKDTKKDINSEIKPEKNFEKEAKPWKAVHTDKANDEAVKKGEKGLKESRKTPSIPYDDLTGYGKSNTPVPVNEIHEESRSNINQDKQKKIPDDPFEDVLKAIQKSEKKPENKKETAPETMGIPTAAPSKDAVLDAPEENADKKVQIEVNNSHGSENDTTINRNTQKDENKAIASGRHDKETQTLFNGEFAKPVHPADDNLSGGNGGALSGTIEFEEIPDGLRKEDPNPATGTANALTKAKEPPHTHEIDLTEEAESESEIIRRELEKAENTEPKKDRSYKISFGTQSDAETLSDLQKNKQKRQRDMIISIMKKQKEQVDGPYIDLTKKEAVGFKTKQQAVPDKKDLYKNIGAESEKHRFTLKKGKEIPITGYGDPQERERAKNHFIYDQYETGDGITLKLIPITAPKQERGDCEIVLFASDGKSAVCDTTKGAVVSVEFEGYRFTAKGNLDDGIFSSSLIITSLNGAEKPSVKKTEVRPEDETLDFGIGHTVIGLDYANSIHVIPAEDQNLSNGLCRAIIVVKKRYGVNKAQSAFIAASGFVDKISGEKKDFTLRMYWKNEMFNVDVKEKAVLRRRI